MGDWHTISHRVHLEAYKLLGGKQENRRQGAEAKSNPGVCMFAPHPRRRDSCRMEGQLLWSVALGFLVGCSNMGRGANAFVVPASSRGLTTAVAPRHQPQQQSWKHRTGLPPGKREDCTCVYSTYREILQDRGVSLKEHHEEREDT